MVTPKTRLIATAQKATITVSFRAFTMSGSARASARLVRPSSKVCWTTRPTGQATSKNT